MPAGQEVASADLLALSDVIASVYQAFPVIQQAELQRNVAQGQIVEAYGAFDTKLQGYSLSEALGNFRNYRQGIGVARQTWWGGYLAAGYRIGRGEFEPWYKERETNEGGEFKLAMGVPLLQGRAIDPARVAVFQASLAGQAAEPLIQEAILRYSREAAMLYWDWLAAGAVLRAQLELLELAVERGENYEVGVNAGLFPPVDLVFNRQLIAERRGKYIESQQKFRTTAMKLGIYLRDEAGQPLMPDDLWLPNRFPRIETLPEGDFQADLAAAVSRRPELQSLLIAQRQVRLDQQLAYNNLLPQLDFITEGVQDVGTPSSRLNDKGQFELHVGIQGEVPIQRRKARGKIQSTAAKIAELDQKLRFQRDKIAMELQAAYVSLRLFERVVAQEVDALRASRETLASYRTAFDAGSLKVDLIYINLLESKVNENAIKLAESQRNWFAALADMQAALGLDPLDEAMVVSSMPPSQF